MVQLRNINSKSLSYDSSSNEYTIVTTPGLGNWGSCVAILIDTIILPFNATCEISFDVYVPSNHIFKIDVNNSAVIGDSWEGNDNDNSQNRGGDISDGNISTTLVANVWTHKKYSYTNDSERNINKVGLNVWDYYCIVTENDTESITYYIRNLNVAISGGGQWI